MSFNTYPLIKALAGILMSTLATATFAAEDSNDTEMELQHLKQEILNLKHKVERLEKSRIPLNKEFEEPAAPEQNQEKKEATAKPVVPWSERVHFNGLVEVEASYADTPEGGKSDLVISTVELGVEAQLNNWVNCHVLVLYEQDETNPPEIDEAIITIANLERSPWSLAVGLQYVPFGNYDSHMVSDPLTLEIGETQETAAQFGFVKDDFHALLYGFKGDTDNEVESLGINLGWLHEAEGGDVGYTLEASWINNLADSNNLQDMIKRPGQLSKSVAGLGLAASLSLENWKFIGEYLGAVGDFDALDLSFNKRGARPQASNLEGAYHFHLFDKHTFAALGWQHSHEALVLELPEDRYLATLGIDVHTNVNLALEYAHDRDYSLKIGGSGENIDTFTLQLVANF